MARKCIRKVFGGRVGLSSANFPLASRCFLGLLVDGIELLVRQFAFARKLRAQTRDRIVEPIFSSSSFVR